MTFKDVGCIDFLILLSNLLKPLQHILVVIQIHDSWISMWKSKKKKKSHLLIIEIYGKRLPCSETKIWPVACWVLVVLHNCMQYCSHKLRETACQ